MQNPTRGGQTTSIENSEGLENIKRLVQKAKKGDGQRYKAARFLGMLAKDNQIKANIPEKDRSMFNCEKYQYLLQSPFIISQKCCDEMKKKPLHRYEKRKKPILGTMAEESRMRTQKWIQNGCNAFNTTHPKSNPMSFWTENDVLTYIHNNHLPIAEAYGDVVVKGTENGQIAIEDVLQDYRDCQFCTTKCKRTGCIFCGFGITQDLNRFVNLNKEEPLLCDYVMRGGAFDTDGMWKPTNDGMGYWFVLEWLNVHGHLKIGIPNRDKYLSKYQTEETRKYLIESEE
jgi:3'-phosphoadenosine 5'-phosphosulfate sulfotransferase (PAPS reductase)/FAD synthetase